jgi:hypothetical protein
MNASLYCSGQTIADCSTVDASTPAAWNVTPGWPLIKVCPLRATHAARSFATRISAFNSRGASMPVANRHRSDFVSDCCRNRAQPDHGTIFESFDEISAIVSEMPRLVPIACAISYSA